jgi:hypothetical protein
LLPAFIAEASAGCMIGPALITSMYTTDLTYDGVGIIKPIPTSEILVTPTNSGLSFAVNSRAAGFYYELIIAFQLSAPGVSGASVSVYGSAVESGAAQVSEYICNGAPFDRPAHPGYDLAWNGCPENGGTMVNFGARIQNTFGQPPPTSATSSVALTATTFIAVANNILVDGGVVDSAATLSSFTNDFSIQATAIPEPRSALLLVAGLFGLSWIGYRRR